VFVSVLLILNGVMALTGNKRSFDVESRNQHGSIQWKIIIKHKRRDKTDQSIGFYPSEACARKDLPLLESHVDKGSRPQGRL
jgi:hypothetical protein